MKTSVGLGIYKISELSPTPKQMTRGSACFDLAAVFHTETVKTYSSYNQEETNPVRLDKEMNKFVTIYPGQRMLVPTGIIFDIPENYSMRIHPRSSMTLKLGLTLGNCEGVIDSDYVHETFVMLVNISESSVYVYEGDRIAQAELVPLLETCMYETVHAPTQKTDRDGGFGSTDE